MTTPPKNFNNNQIPQNQSQTQKYRNFFASVSSTQEQAIQRVKEMKFFVEKWINVLGFFAPFCLLAAGVFVLVKSMFGFAGVVDDFYEGEKKGKDVKTMIAENKEQLRMQREQKRSGVFVDKTAEEFKDEILSKEQLYKDLQKQQQSVAPKPKELQQEEQELKKLDPTQDFLQSAVNTDGIKVVSDQKVTSQPQPLPLPPPPEIEIPQPTQSVPGFVLTPPTQEQINEQKSKEKLPVQNGQTQQIQKEKTIQKEKCIQNGQTQQQIQQKQEVPDKVFAFQLNKPSEKQSPIEVSRPWWYDLDKFSIVQFKLREDEQTMPLYIDTNFEQEIDQDHQPLITIIAFESFEEAVDFYKYMVPRWKFDAEQGGEYPMWQEVEKMDIQQLQPIDFMNEVENLGYRVEVIPKGQIEFSGDMTYADFYERVLTVCKIPGWEEVVMQHAEWEDFDSDLNGAIDRQKRDVQYTGPGSLEGAKGFTVL